MVDIVNSFTFINSQIMKKLSFVLILMCISTICLSQTKKIAHRSHSGSNKTFSIIGAGNFGLPEHKASDSTKKKETVRKDSTLVQTPPAKKASSRKTKPVKKTPAVS
jgi:hypothetical protein